MDIRLDNIDNPVVIQLLQEHHEDMLKHSPVESVHALDLSSLKAVDVSFYTVWLNGELAGCGALKALNENHVELKSMRTSRTFLRKGVAAKLLTHLLAIAKNQAYKKISLETGTADAFIPAQKLYQNFGFVACLPFSDYQEDPYSMFLTKDLADSLYKLL